MREIFETYGGVIIAGIVTATIISGIILMLSSGDVSTSDGALRKLILAFFESIS